MRPAAICMCRKPVEAFARTLIGLFPQLIQAPSHHAQHSEKVVAPNCALGQQALFRRAPREERAHACFDRRSPGMSSLVDGTSATLLQRRGQRQQRRPK